MAAMSRWGCMNWTATCISGLYVRMAGCLLCDGGQLLHVKHRPSFCVPCSHPAWCHTAGYRPSVCECQRLQTRPHSGGRSAIPLAHACLAASTIPPQLTTDGRAPTAPQRPRRAASPRALQVGSSSATPYSGPCRPRTVHTTQAPPARPLHAHQLPTPATPARPRRQQRPSLTAPARIRRP
jgi:hypothetical protein